VEYIFGVAEINGIKHLVPPGVDTFGIKVDVASPDSTANVPTQIALLAELHDDEKVGRLWIKVD